MFKKIHYQYFRETVFNSIISKATIQNRKNGDVLMGGSKEGYIVILTGKLKFWRKILDIQKSAALKEKKKKKRWKLSFASNSRLHVSIEIVDISATLEG